MANMTKRLNIPPYDLKQDILVEKLQSLKNIAMVYASASLYKQEDFTVEIHQIWNAVMKLDITCEEKWKILMKKVEYKFLNSFDCLDDKIIKQICFMNDFVGKRIFKFFSKEVSPKEISLFFNNFVFTSQGTINTYKTVLRILDKKDLTNEFKFTFACKYFMGEERIKKYLFSLPNPVKEWFKQLETLKHYSTTPLYYWSNKIEKKRKMKIDSNTDSKFSKENLDKASSFIIACRSKIKKYQEYYLLKWAISTKNDIAVQYLWENLVSSSKVKEEILIELSDELVKYGCQNIFVYLLQQTTELSSEWFSDRSQDILGQLLIDCRWKNSFVKIAENIESRFRFFDFKTIRNIISLTYKSKNPSQERDKYCKILQECLWIIPKQNYVNTMLKVLYDENVYEIIFPSIDSENRKLFKKLCDLIRINNLGLGFLKCLTTLFHAAVIKENVNFIEIIFNEISDSENEYLKIILSFLNKRAFEICDSLLNNNEWESLNKLINWFSKFYSEKDARILKHSIIYNFNATLIRKIISEGAGIPYTQYPSKPSHLLSLKLNEEISEQTEKKRFSDAIVKLDDLLSWSLESEEEIMIFKNLFFEVGDIGTTNLSKEIQKLLLELIFKEKLNFLDELFIWSCIPKSEILLYKQSFPKNTNMILAFSKKNKLCNFLKYIEWCEKVDYEI